MPAAERLPPLRLPDDFPSAVTAFASDLDRTLIGDSGVLTSLAEHAIRRARAAGIPVIVATGRMFRSVRPFLLQAGISEPVVCYQGAVVADPVTGEFLQHHTLELELARSTIAFLDTLGHAPNCYVDDELYVGRHTEYSKAYAEFQHLPVTEVGDLAGWLSEPPTKLVVVGKPEELPDLRAELAGQLDGQAFLTTSLPWLLEIGPKGISKGEGIEYVSERLDLGEGATVAFGDGENDIELLRWADYAVAVEAAHPLLRDEADWVCPGPESDGVAHVIAAHLEGMT